MILLTISSSETFKAKTTSSGNWWRAAKYSTMSATRVISDRLLSIRISQDVDNPACGGTEDPVFIAATRSWATIRRTIAAYAGCAIAGTAFCCGTADRRRGRHRTRPRRPPRAIETVTFAHTLRAGRRACRHRAPACTVGFPPHQPAGRLACIPTWTLTCIPAFDLLPRLCPRIPRLGRWWAVSPGRDPASATHRVAGATERPALDAPGL